jgi:hypothetical protein
MKFLERTKFEEDDSDMGRLPSGTIVSDFDNFLCYNCDSGPQFSSFLSLCLQ